MAFTVVDRTTLSRLFHVDIRARMEPEHFPKARAVDGAAPSLAPASDETLRALGYVE